MVKMSISKGNMKIGNISNFSLTPGLSCPAICHKTCLVNGTCYAMKSYRQYPNVRNAWDNNTATVLFNLPGFVDTMTSYLSKYKKPFFRIHVAGDFISKEYYRAWVSIIKQYPDIKFLAYTKAYDIVASEEKPGNLQLIYSMWHNIPEEATPGNVSRAWVNDGIETRHTQAIKCPGNCTKCKICYGLDELQKDVYFDIH